MLVSLCLAGATFTAYVAEIASVDTTYDDYVETICSIVNYTEDYSHTYCRANISVNYNNGESQNLTNNASECSVPLVSGEWMEVRKTNQRGSVCDDKFEPGSLHKCLIHPDSTVCKEAVSGWNKDPVCSTKAIDGTDRTCDFLPILAAFVGGFVILTCITTVFTMVLQNDCLLDTCWTGGVRWTLSWSTILLYIIVWGLTIYCTYSVNVNCGGLFLWGNALIVEGCYGLCVLFPYLMYQSYNISFAQLMTFLFFICLTLYTSSNSYNDIWNNEPGVCGLWGWQYDYVHFLWVFSLQLNILFGLPPLFVLLGEIFFQASEVYTDTMERRRKELFSELFSDHLRQQKQLVNSTLQSYSSRNTADSNVSDLIFNYSFELESLVSMDSSKQTDEISDRLFVNSFFNIGLTKEQVCNIDIDKKYQNLFDRLKLKLGRWTDFHPMDGKEI